MTYYLYHIPGKKIGVTTDLKERVERQQGYESDEYEILMSTEDIDFISNEEIKLQKLHGYRVDRQLYKNLHNNNYKQIEVSNMKVKNITLILSILFSAILIAQNEAAANFSSLEEINQYLLERTEKNEFSGVVLIAKDGEPIFKNAYGYASKRFDVPNRIDTKFNIGSLSKHLTSIAILQLVEKN